MEQQPEERPDALAQAYATVERDRRTRAGECAEAVLEVLQKYGCKIEVELSRQPDGTFRPAIHIEAQ